MAVEEMDRVSFLLPGDKMESVQGKILSSAAFEPVMIREAAGTDGSRALVAPSANPYDELYVELQSFLKMSSYRPEFTESALDLDGDVAVTDILQRFRNLNDGIRDIFNWTAELKKIVESYEKVLFHVNVLSRLEVDLEDIVRFEMIRLVFGRVPISHFQPLVDSSAEVPILILEVNRDSRSVWVFVFCPPDVLSDAYRILHAAYFQEDSIPEGYAGTPRQVKSKLEARIQLARLSIQENDIQIQILVANNREFVDGVYSTIVGRKRVFDLAAYGGFSAGGNIFFLDGWMPRVDADELEEVVSQDAVVLRKPAPRRTGTADGSPDGGSPAEVPVKFRKSNRFFEAFQSITTMFGTPRYDEVDPTPLVALFFTLMFGFMLGDVGHGAVLLCLGLLLRRSSGKLGTVMISASASSMVFGFLYGSIFGFDWLPPLWLKPMVQTDQLMVVAVGFGIAVILAGMVLNVVNGIRQGDREKALFGGNGLAGMLAYVVLVGSAAFYAATGRLPVDARVLAAAVGGLLLLVFFSAPLGALVDKGRFSVPEGFALMSSVHLFNLLIEFLSNTISFVRLAAFALTHEALFLAFWIMAGMVSHAPLGGVWATAVFLFGQMILVGLEGLVVLIQDLRLTYYEYFVKFFDGSGREFKPLTFERS